MPANQSRPSAPNGAGPDMQTVARTRPGKTAAQARACGPPPESPMTANRSMPSASATLATSAAADATSRPGCGVDRPYPGRSCETQRMPRSAAAANSGSGGAPVLGVPRCQKTASPAVPSPVPVS